MKILLSTACTLLFIGAAFANTGKSVPIAVSDKGILIANRTIDLPCTLEKLQAILGKSDRLHSLANDIYVWDKTGIFVYCKPKTKIVHTIAILIGEARFKFSPKSKYVGKLKISNKKVAFSREAQELKRLGFVPNELVPTFQEYKTGKYSIFAITNDDGTKIRHMSIEATSKDR